jgi:hypothetical protein
MINTSIGFICVNEIPRTGSYKRKEKKRKEKKRKEIENVL